MVVFSPACQEWNLTSCRSEPLKTLFQVLGASFLLAFCSQIKIVLPFTLVPLTFQTLAVLLIGATLGSRKGAMAILLYYAEILAGLPVLSGGVADPLIFLGPKAGYVLGFCIQAYCIGWFAEREIGSKPMALFIGGFVGSLLQMAFGVVLLAIFVGWNHVWMMGAAPFIPGEMLKILFVAFCLRR